VVERLVVDLQEEEEEEEEARMEVQGMEECLGTLDIQEDHTMDYNLYMEDNMDHHSHLHILVGLEDKLDNLQNHIVRYKLEDTLGTLVYHKVHYILADKLDNLAHKDTNHNLQMVHNHSLCFHISLPHP
jgi:hypothetical protein